MIGCGVCLKCFVMYVLLIELLPGNEALTTSCLFFIDGLVFIFSPIFLLYVSKNTMIFSLFSIIIVICSIIAFFFIRVSESLKWLLAKGNFEEVRAIIRQILKTNSANE